jgi:hypothetical protein
MSTFRDLTVDKIRNRNLLLSDKVEGLAVDEFSLIVEEQYQVDVLLHKHRVEGD